jgi:Sigma-54 interaction domain
MKLLIEKNGLGMTRQFVENDEYANLLKAFRYAATSKPIRKAINRVIKPRKIEELLKDSSAIFLRPVPLPWHLKILLSRTLPMGKKPRVSRKTICHTGIYRRVRGYDYYEMTSSSHGKLPPPKFERPGSPSTADQRSTADLLLALSPELVRLVDVGGVDVNDYLQDFTIRTSITNVVRRSAGRWELEFNWNVRWNIAYDRFLIAVCRGVIDDPGAKKLLISSDNFAEAFLEIADLWHQPGFENFLLIAPPGAGKEVLLNALAYGLDLALFPFLLGRQPVEAIESKLFGTGQQKGLLSNFIGKKGISKALIFLDEIDKTTEDARGSLLRLLESKDYLGSGGKILKLRDGIKFGFAGSKSFEEMTRLAPSDFWTRIQKTIVMDHPLQMPNAPRKRPGTLRQILESYFIVFWKGECDKALKEAASKFEEDIVFAIAPWHIAKQLAQSFAKVVSDPFLGTISVRTLRAAVAVVFFEVYKSVLLRSDVAKPVSSMCSEMEKLLIQRVFLATGV